MAKFPINLSQFKKVKDASDHVVLRHPHGHEFKIAKKPLSSHLRSQLDQLPSLMADGGESPNKSVWNQGQTTPSDSGLANEPKDSPAEEANKAEVRSDFQKQAKSMAHEYENQPKPSEYEAEPSKETPPPSVGKIIGLKKADGGEIKSDDEIIQEKEQIDQYNKTHEDEPKEYPQDVEAKLQKTEVTPKKYADGGKVGGQKGGDKAFYKDGTDDASQDDQESSAAPQAPVTINVGGGMPVASSPQALSSGMAPPQQPAANQPNAPQPGQQTPVQGPEEEPITYPGGLKQELRGQSALANAQEQQANAQQAVAEGNARAQLHLMNQFQESHQKLQDEYNNTMDDIKSSHIDPNHYLGSMDTGGKMLTAAGLILGGMGGGGQGNQALDFLNRQIDRDIEAQKAELGKKETLLSANLRQFGNLRDATDMTKSIMLGMQANNFEAAGLKSQGQIAQAQSQIHSGQLKQQAASTLQQLAMRQMLTSGADVSSIDPAQLAPYMVGSEKQKDQAIHEIGVAQDTAKAHDQLMSLFDQADKENTILKTGFGMARTPASILSMRAMMLPLIHDKEGRVNEFEQKTTSDLEPKPGDLPDKIAEKRAGFEKFLTQKESAPYAKSLGLDLGKFKSTSASPEARLSPQQQSLVKWARENPNNPKSAMVLKKLGLQ